MRWNPGEEMSVMRLRSWKKAHVPVKWEQERVMKGEVGAMGKDQIL